MEPVAPGSNNPTAQEVKVGEKGQKRRYLPKIC
jgi:hypothetical protein